MSYIHHCIGTGVCMAEFGGTLNWLPVFIDKIAEIQLLFRKKSTASIPTF